MKEQFFLFIDEVADKLESYVEQNKSFLIVSNLEADGLAATTLLSHYFYYSGVEFQVTFLDKIDIDSFKKMAEYPQDFIIFVDFGAGLLGRLSNFSSKKPILIIDHHDISVKDRIISGDIFQLNPRVFGIDGSRDASSSVITYLLLKSLGHDFYDIEYLGLVGALGDYQDIDGLKEINKRVLDELVEHGILAVKKGLKITGLYSKPLYKALEYSMEIYIPNVTGNEKAAMRFLKDLKIGLKRNNSFTTYADLSDEEVKKLISEVIKLRLMNNVNDAEAVVGDIYLINKNLIFRDLREIAYVLSAAGKMGKPSLAITAYLGSRRDMDKLYDLVLKYKSKLMKILQAIYSGKVSTIEKDGYIIIDLTQFSPGSLISSIANIIATSGIFPSGRILIFLDEKENELVISLRFSKKAFSRELYRSIERSILKVGGYMAGHDNFGGGIIPKEKLDEFLREFKIAARQEGLIL